MIVEKTGRSEHPVHRANQLLEDKHRAEFELSQVCSSPILFLSCSLPLLFLSAAFSSLRQRIVFASITCKSFLLPVQLIIIHAGKEAARLRIGEDGGTRC